jgi:hypothetical protein
VSETRHAQEERI